MVRKTTPARQLGLRIRHLVLSHLPLFLLAASRCLGQATTGDEIKIVSASAPAEDSGGGIPSAIDRWLGLPVRKIAFEGIQPARLQPLPGHLSQAVGAPLTRENVAQSLRQLYATGLFDTIEAEASRQDDGVRLVFRGAPRTFIGVVSVNGAKGATMNTQLERAARLNAGTRFTQRRLDAALDSMRQVLADNGFHASAITYTLTGHSEDQLVDIAFQAVSGVQARVGTVEVSGDSGMTVDQFKRAARLRVGARVDHDTTNRALSGVLRHYQKQDRLEADVKLEKHEYIPDTKRSNFGFSANRGPVVKVNVEGAKLSSERLKRLVPVFEEGTVDEDLLNEGSRRLRDYFQRMGYFDVKVDHTQRNPDGQAVTITYTVNLGARRRVKNVSVAGNHYFNSKTLEELLSVRAADYLDRHGTYSQALVASDVAALEAVYQNNGFSNVKVTPETVNSDDPPVIAGTMPVRSPTQPISVIYHIDEGQQQRVGEVRIDGAENSDTNRLLSLMNTAPGQLFSPQNLAGDRDALLTDFLSRGFEQVQIEVDEQTQQSDPTKVDVVFHVHEGRQVFVGKVLLTGLHFTRPDTVARSITLHPGDPLNQTALAQTQRNLYEFALFNEVNTAIQNPGGDEQNKTVLIQTTEARRWTLIYGLGFETQTGAPQNNCAGIALIGLPCNPNGKTGISPRVLISVTRNNLFGRDQSASVQATYGLLEQNVKLLFQNPRFFGNRDLGFTFSGGYASSQNVTTYVSSKLETGVRWTQRFSQPGSFFSRANTFVYAFDFRRVKVSEDSLQVGPSEIQALSTAVRVAGPSVTWIRDTRDSPLDSHRGTYSSIQDFLSRGTFGAEAQFNRLDISNSSYYGFDKNRFVLARNTRYGQERAYGSGSERLLPLPERLYAGGPISHRGFAINAAGPRDPETGFPIGGAGALVNSTEMRLPPPILPFFGDSVSFVLFHDMGNVFTNAGDAWESALRIHQPDRDLCKVLTPPDLSTNPPTPPKPTGPITSTGQQGHCSFNYFSHAAGLGMRYHTPVGPIRLDFSYNLNPPIYPVNINYSIGVSPTTPLGPYSNQHVGQAPHFNFFFSLGQTF
ncbi:MAG TPA: POTRA domain-containing protein [Terracidiphilus sp.]|nr:POTRA domain-containing protein [Terracidiphilus sp.]